MPRVLPPEPFGAWMTTKIAQLGGLRAAGWALATDEAQLRRLAAGNLGSRLQLKTVDRLFVAAGEPHMLAVLYPLDVGGLEERWCSTCAETVTAERRRPCPWCFRDPPSVQRRRDAARVRRESAAAVSRCPAPPPTA